LIAVFFLGGSMAVHKVAAQTDSSANTKLPSDEEMHKAGFTDQQIENLKVISNLKWMRVAGETAMEGTKQVAFSTFGQPVGSSKKKNLGIGLVCRGPKTLVELQAGPVRSGNIRLKFDNAPVISQTWTTSGEMLLSREPRALAHQILNARQFKVEFFAPDGSPQVFEFKVLDLKDLVAKEPLCHL